MTEPEPVPPDRAGQPDDVNQHIPDGVLAAAIAEAVQEHGQSDGTAAEITAATP